MTDVGTAIFKRYGIAAVVCAALAAVVIWSLAHWAAAPGSEVSILWGLVKYTKKPYLEVKIETNPQIATTKSAPPVPSIKEKPGKKPLLPLTLTVRHDVNKNNLIKISSELRSQLNLRELTATESGKPVREIPAGTYFFVYGAGLDSSDDWGLNSKLNIDFLYFFNRNSVSRYPRPAELYAEVQYPEGKELNLILFFNEQAASQITSLSGNTQHKVIATLYPWGSMTSLVSVPVVRIRESRMRRVEISKDDDAYMLDLVIQ